MDGVSCKLACGGRRYGAVDGEQIILLHIFFFLTKKYRDKLLKNVAW
jgi:hypothetical protein